MSQNFNNHARFVPLYHYFLALLVLLVFIGSCVNLYHSWGDSNRFYSASLLVAVSVIMILTAYFARSFPLKAQDRAIRAEENLRHFVLTGKLLDPRLQIGQIIALRFAGDAEFPKLAKEAAEKNLDSKTIKKAITQWREDNDRV
jgi:cell division protein FtsW (lipid II flippase)